MADAEAGEFYNIISILSGDRRDYLVFNNGDEVKIADLNAPFLGIYFSASWCPHCKSFNSQLTEVYNNLSSENKGFQIVLISLDWSEEEFNEYFSPMPWLAVPFSEWETRQRLTDLFKITGIPTLITLDGKSGRFMSNEAAEFVVEYGSRAYPFTLDRVKELKDEKETIIKNQTLESLLVSPERDYVLSSKGNKVTVGELEGIVVGLYFSHNSGNQFTSTLSQLHEKLREQGEKFEIIMVPSDEDRSTFDKSISTTQWLTVPFKDKTIEHLIEYFEVSNFPTLVIIGSDGKTLNFNATDIIENYGVEAVEWFPFSNEKLRIMEEIERTNMELQTLESLLISRELYYVVRKDRRKVPVLDLVGKTVLLYFSAEWSRSCCEFQPKLISYYNEIKKKQSPFEIVFISNDRDQCSYENFFSSMPWLALLFEDSRKNPLKRALKVRSIPSLVIIGPDGKTVSRNGKKLLMTYGADAFPFTDERIEELKKSSRRSEVNFKELTSKGEANEAMDTVAFDLIDKFVSMIPNKLQHELHEEHELVLTRLDYGDGYCCYECELSCERWSYRCNECDFDLHPLCALDPIE
ncbi:Nucleoredoxin [Rhynchospora pubera]|uniref:protein-disulfide reductase n=1 Tax=Rhynchospora pubera TaxID=906938 RepID=A0AAV8CHL1_9POAL|nr:Nucleoredoxin [Rhynchospora pubera]